MDFATSSHPAVTEQLARLAALSPGADILGLSRIAELLRRLARTGGVYVPAFYDVTYHADGRIAAVRTDVPAPPPGALSSSHSPPLPLLSRIFFVALQASLF